MIGRHQFTPKSLGQDGLVEFRQEPRRVGVLGGDEVEPDKGGLYTADDLSLHCN
jgi:hypothetical protein